MVITDAWGGYNSLGARGYEHLPVVESGLPEVAEEYLPIVHLVFSEPEGVAARHAPRARRAPSTCKPTSMSSRSALTGASTRSTPSARCLASARTAKARPMTGFTRALGSIRQWLVIMTDRQPLGAVCVKPNKHDLSKGPRTFRMDRVVRAADTDGVLIDGLQSWLRQKIADRPDPGATPEPKRGSRKVPHR